MNKMKATGDSRSPAIFVFRLPFALILLVLSTGEGSKGPCLYSLSAPLQ